MLDLTSMRIHVDVLDILVAVFEGDHAVRCLYPEDGAYPAHFPGFALALGGRAFDGGVVNIEYGGAALLAPLRSEPRPRAHPHPPTTVRTKETTT